MDYRKPSEKKLGWVLEMAIVQINMSELNGRVQSVRELLLPLRQSGVTVACQVCRHLYKGCKVIAAHDGIKSVESFHNWHFQTFASNVMAQYYEFWRPFDGDSKLMLYRAYLNVVVVNRESHNFDKLVSVHCDPCEVGETRQVLYKQGPHLHVQKAVSPIPKCHFPLNLGDLNKVLASVDNITNALKDAVAIVCDEVLFRF